MFDCTRGKVNIITIPFPLDAMVETSVIIAMDKLTFPLLIPPTILAKTNIAKFLDKAHNI